MHFGTKMQPVLATVSLQNAVLCVDCESLSQSRDNECPVCRSHSIFRIAPVLGGTLLARKNGIPEQDGNAVTFNLEIAISLKYMKARDVNTMIKGITSLIYSKLENPSLEQGNASLHVNVAPVTNGCSTVEEAA